MSTATSPFTLLGLPEDYALDFKAAEQGYLAAASRHHPDRLRHRPAAEQTGAAGMLVSINEAFALLKDDYRRGVWLYEQRTGTTFDATVRDAGLLEQALEDREALESIGSPEELKALSAAAQKQHQVYKDQAISAFAAGDMAGAREALLRLRYAGSFVEACRQQYGRLP
ncbi:MAG: iron-sulfur cluster co-chaperone HscB C-terminal domain-containing protein [Holosporales bacterium]